jgi:hypothetical protein
MKKKLKSTFNEIQEDNKSVISVYKEFAKKGEHFSNFME